MSLLVKRGDFQMTTGAAATVLNIRSIGFQGAFVIFWWNGRDGTVDASGEVSYRGGFGFATASGQRCLIYSSLHAAANSSVDSGGYDTACVATVLPAASGVLEGRASFTGFVSDGFDITIDDAFATAFRVHFIVVGGTEVTNLDVRTITGPGAPGTLDTSLDWQPDLLVALNWGGGITSANSVNAGHYFSIGMATSPLANDQAVLASAQDDNQATMATFNFCRRGRLISAATDSAESAVLSALLSDGYRLNYLIGNTSLTFILAVKGGRYAIKHGVTSVTTSATITLTGADFPPKACMVFSGTQPETAIGTTDAIEANSIGAADAVANQAVLGLQDKNAAATSDTFTAMDTNQVYVNADLSATQVVEGLMALASFTSDGATFTMTDGDPLAEYFFALFFGEAAPSSGEDSAGLIYRGAPIRYVDTENIEVGGFLESAQAARGDAIDVSVLRPVGTVLQKATITSVPYYRESGAGPYWLRYDDGSSGGRL